MEALLNVFVLMRINKSPALILYLILCTIACCIGLLWYYLQSKNNNQIYKPPVEEAHVSGESINIDYDDLDPAIKTLIEDRISEGVARKANEGVNVFCKKYKINDDMEKNLIWFNADVGKLFDSYSGGNSILSICLIKSRQTIKIEQKVTISNSFQFQFPNSNMKLEYKCLEGDINTPIALIRAIHIQDNEKPNSVDMILYYTKDNEWKKLE
jgi:hypothetical protein